MPYAFTGQLVFDEMAKIFGSNDMRYSNQNDAFVGAFQIFPRVAFLLVHELWTAVPVKVRFIFSMLNAVVFESEPSPERCGDRRTETVEFETLVRHWIG